MPSERIILHRVWNGLVSLAATAAALLVPAGLVPGFFRGAQIAWFETLLTVIFVADAGVWAWRARRGPARYRGRHRYSAAWLALDILAAFPFYLLLGPTLFQLLRLLKLVRVALFMRWWRQAFVVHANVLRLAFFAYWLVLTAHAITCGWVALRGLTEFTNNWERYIHALYWCVTTLTTVGYGDIVPENNAERLYAIVVMLIGVGVYGFVIGNIAGILAKIDPARARYAEQLERIDTFLKYKRVPAGLQHRIHEYYEYLWENRRGHNEAALLTDLPPRLRTEIALFLKRDLIDNVPLFQGTGDAFLREVALKMEPVVFAPGDYVFRAGAPGQDMYFISRGTVEVVSVNGETVIATLADGDCFGEIALVLNRPRTAGVRARTYCDLYRLDRTTFERILAHHPHIAAHIEAIAHERYEAEMEK